MTATIVTESADAPESTLPELFALQAAGYRAGPTTQLDPSSEP